MFFVFPRSPAHSRFLTAEQKAHIVRRLKLDSPAGVDSFEESFSWAECRKAFTSPHVILLFIALFGNGLTLCTCDTSDVNKIRVELMPSPSYRWLRLLHSVRHNRLIHCRQIRELTSARNANRTIVQTFGYSTIQTQLLTVPPFVLAFFLTMFNAWWSDRYGRRGLCSILMSLIVSGELSVDG